MRLAAHRPTPAQRIGRIADLVDTVFAWLLVALLGMSVVTAIGVAVTAYAAPSWATRVAIVLLVTHAALGVLVFAVVAARQAITAHQRATEGWR